jgi:hypothetical protein
MHNFFAGSARFEVRGCDILAALVAASGVKIARGESVTREFSERRLILLQLA